MPSKAKATAITDHDEIRRWAEERGAQPACVRNTGNRNDVGIIRLEFPNSASDKSLEVIEWEEWFDKFDDQGLALIHQDTLANGKKSNFNKLVSRETANASESRATPIRSAKANTAPKVSSGSKTKAESTKAKASSSSASKSHAAKPHSPTRKAA